MQGGLMSKGLLDGVKVLEYGNLVSAPFCAKILGDFGAEVIKIEAPLRGDDARRREPFLNDSPNLEHSGLFLYLNLNKRGITLNPETATGRAIFDRLVKGSDILVENNSPRKMAKLGMTYNRIAEVNPSIVMTSITPFGQTGPYRDYMSCELINTSIGAVAYASTREVSADDEPLKMPAHLFAFQAGLSAAAATLGALYRQGMTGRGEHLDVSELESLVQNLDPHLVAYRANKQIVSRTDRLSRAPFHILACKDGFIYNAFSEEKEWRKFVQVMGSPEWAENELFKDYSSRAQYWDALKPLIEEWTKNYTMAEIYRKSQENGAPVGAVYSAKDLLSDRQLSTRGFFVDIPDRTRGRFRYPGVPYICSTVPRQAPAPAPLLGQDNEAIYCGRLGYRKGDLRKLAQAGII